MPPSLAFAEAATVPTVFLTAYECLREAADAKTGSRVLVHAATGKFPYFHVQKGFSPFCSPENTLFGVLLHSCFLSHRGLVTNWA